MSDVDFVIEILARLKDQAGPGIAKLKAEIDSLKSSQDAERGTDDLADSIGDLGKEADKTKGKHEDLRKEHEKLRRVSEDAGRGTRDLTRDVADSAKTHDRAADSVGGHTKTQEDFAEALADVKKKSADVSGGLEDLDTRVSKLDTSWKDFDRTLSSGELSKGEAALKVRQYANEIRSLSKETETGSQGFRDLANDLERANKLLKDPNFGSTGGALKSFSRGDVGEGLESLSHKFDSLGLRITGVSSFLRGFFDLAKIGLSQQLITGVISLAGGLLSVASAAAQAGAALVGVFISGLGQAIPMVAVVAASLERFKNILQAVSVAGQAEQQHFYDPTEKQVTQLQNISQLISAQQQLSNSSIQLFEAQQRVKDSQIELTEARYTAQRQIIELSLAEKNARLEAEGANLSLTESKRQLAVSIQKGDAAGIQQAELAVKEAELSKKKAEYEIPKAAREARLARQRGVGGAPSVISAVEGLEGAKVAVLQAKQAGEAAERQEQITKLQQAARSSKETTYESQLKFLKKGMSPTELGLTDALIGIEKELKSPDSPLKKITDYFVEPFTDAIERIRSLLKNASFLGPIDELAKAMGAGLGKLEKSTYGGEGTSFFETMAKDASSNIPVVTGAIEGLMKLFEDVAKAADPAFHKLSEDWDRFWHDLDRKYEGNGLESLTNFFNKSAEYAERFAHLGAAIFELFKAIGHDAAPQGLDTVNSLSEGIKKATEWVQSHGPQVTKFFSEAKEGLSVIGGMLFSIGVSLIKVFSLSSLSAFSGFLKEVLLPGLRNVVTVFGFITKVVLDLFNVFGRAGSVILEVIGTIGVFVAAVSKIWILFKELKEAWLAFVVAFDVESLISPWTALAIAVGATVAALSIFDTEQKKVKISTEEVNDALKQQAEALREIKNLNDEYKSAELSVKESRTQVTSAEQYLSRSKKEPLQQGESESERRIKIESNEQQLQRAQITRNEREKEFEKLPERQKEESSEKNLLSKKGVEAAANKVKELTNRVKEDRETLSIAAPEYRSEIQSHLIGEEKELTAAKEQLTGATKKNSEVTKQSNDLISQSVQATVKDAPRLNEAYAEAYKKFEESVSKGAGAAKSGMESIREYVDKALKRYGVTPAEIAKAEIGHNKAGGEIDVPIKHAAGAYVRAQSGGQRATIAEGGHDEVVLSTDPRHASRSRQLLGQYFSNAPHMASGGFVADPGTNFTVNQEPKIVTELRKLGEYLGTTIYGISGYRSPSHSVEVGGFANDPHTRGEAADIGVGSNSRESADRLTSALLAKFDLYRPFYPASAAEINHVQLLPGDAGNIVGSSAGIGLSSSSPLSQSINKIMAPMIKGGGAVGSVAQHALDIAAKAANIFVGKHGTSGASSAGIVGAGWTGTWVHVMEQIAKAKNWSLSAWRNVVNRESGGRPGVMNSIGAFGLGQFLPMNYGKYGPGSRPGSTPDEQIESMAEYIACVPMNTKILTKTGWKIYSEVKIGDETIGFNIQNKKSEWTRITDIHFYKNTEVMELKNKRWKSVSTPNHKWIGEKLIQVKEGDNYRKEEYIRTDSIGTRQRIRLAAIADTGLGLSLDKYESEILGWNLGDGTLREGSHSRLDMTISQAKQKGINRIEKILNKIPHTKWERKYKCSGKTKICYTWRLSAPYARELLKRSGFNNDLEAMILEMSSEQRSEFLKGIEGADGHSNNGNRMIAQNSGKKMNAINLVSYLNGFYGRPTDIKAGNNHQHLSLGNPFVKGGMKSKILPKQDVWCVSTDLGSWTMKQDDVIMLTGNSRYQDPSNALAHEEQYNWYATGGLIGDQVRRVAIRHLRKKVLKFAQGGRAPWGGAPVPIIAHEGERVLNPAQFSETARLAGTSPGGLDHHLGYDGSPRQHFADGGPVITGYHAQPTSSGSSESAMKLPGLGSIYGLNIENINILVKVLKAISEGVEKIGKAKSPEKYKKSIETFFESLEKSFEVMNEGREFLKAKFTRGAVGREYTETGKFSSRGQGYKSSGNQGTVALGKGGETKIAEESFKSLREENLYLEKEQNTISKSISSAEYGKKHSKSKSAVAMYTQEYNILVKKQKELGELVVNNIEARYQAEVQTLQDKITEANNAYQTISQEKSTEISSAQSMGNLGQVGSLESQMKGAAESQLQTLAPLLQQAESIGNKELENSIKQEMINLRQTITNAVVENITNAQTLIQRESGAAESKTSLLQSLSKVAAQKGNFAEAGSLEKQALEGKGTALSAAKQQEESLREQALREGDTSAVITLTEEINKNTGEIEENNLALKENAVVTRELVMNYISQNEGVKTGIAGSLKQAYEILGTTTGYVNVSGELGAVKSERSSRESANTEYEKTGKEFGFKTEGMTPQSLLQYLSSPEAQSVITRIESTGTEGEKNSLSKWLSSVESNSTAILKNTEEIAKLNGQLNQPQSFSTQAWSQMRGAFFGGMGQLLPQYSSMLPPGSVPTEMPKYGEMAPGPSRGPTIGTVNLTHPVEKIDTQLFGEELSHHIGSAQGMG